MHALTFYTRTGTDNTGEFATNNFIQICKNFGITVKTTAARSP